MKSTDAFYRDANYVPITNEGIITKRSVTFLGGTADQWGDDAGAKDGGALFTVTGLVRAKLVGVCTVDLAGGATLEVGIAGATAIFGKQITDTGLDVGQIYLNETPAAYYIIGEEQAAADNFPEYLLNGQDIILTTTTTNTTSGAIDFYCIWNPISADGSVVATTD